MKKAFRNEHEDRAKKILTTIIRPTIEFAAVAWRSLFRLNIDALERVHRWAPTLKDLNYKENLSKITLPPQEERRNQGNMIMLYNCPRKNIVIVIKEERSHLKGQD